MITKIVIFDGECAFCNSSVLFILKRSKRNDIFVTSSQSDYGQELMAKHQITADPTQTIIYLENEKVYIRSNAVLQLTKSLRALYPVLYVFKLIPKVIRDSVYNFISKRRKRLIKTNSCSFELANTYADKVLA